MCRRRCSEVLYLQVEAGQHAAVTTTWALAHLLHFTGFAWAFGSSLSIHRLVGIASQHSASQKSGLEIGARKLVLAGELAGLGLAILGGILALVDNPSSLNPAASGAGAWLHIKLSLVLVLTVVAHLRMFRLARLVRERAAGASEADCDALLAAAKTFGLVDLALYVAIFFIATFRFVLFA